MRTKMKEKELVDAEADLAYWSGIRAGFPYAAAAYTLAFAYALCSPISATAKGIACGITVIVGTFLLFACCASFTKVEKIKERIVELRLDPYTSNKVQR